MQSLIQFVKNTKIYKRVLKGSFISPGLHSQQHPMQFLLQQVKNGAFNRYDTIVRYLAIAEHCGENDYGWALYRKMQEIRNVNSPENIDSGIYQSRFEALIESVKENGLDENNPIHSNDSNELMDGSHRLACALYFNAPVVYVKNIEQGDVDFGMNWFEQHFSELETKQIQNVNLKTTNLSRIWKT